MNDNYRAIIAIININLKKLNGQKFKKEYTS